MQHEILIRLLAFFGIFALLAALEATIPRRARIHPRGKRWITNLVISALNTGALRLLTVALPLLAIGAAWDAQQRGWGVLNQLSWPLGAEIIVAILTLDLAIWLQHLITHKVPLFWRFHRMHHSDRDMDVTTALRFHPVEILASMVVKIGVVYALGAPAVAVLIFEVILNGTALFSHANLRLSPGLDGWLRLIMVTPDMHRIHHSALRAEHDSNFGFALSIWDRIFHTYVSVPKAGQDAVVVGLEWQDDRPTKLGWSLLLPFRRN